MAYRRLHPLVEGALRAAAEVGEKAARRAIDSVMEDGQRAAENIHREIIDARGRVGDGDIIDIPFYDPEIRIRQVDTEDDMGERRRRKRARAREPELRDDPPPSSDTELMDLQDAETFLRHGWMLLDELADHGVFSKDSAKDLESILTELRDQITEHEEPTDD